MRIERVLWPAMRLPATGLLALLTVGVLSLWTVEAEAILPSPDATVFEIPLPEAALTQNTADLPAAADAASVLNRRYGGRWQATLWNRTSATPQMVIAPGARIAPGTLAGDEAAASAAMSFVASNADVLRAKIEDLVVERVVRGAGKVGVHFAQQYHGIPVHGARVKTLWSEGGELAAFGSTFHRAIDVNPVPALSAAAAEGVAREALPFNPATDQVLSAPELRVLPVPQAGGGARYHLVWRVVVGTAEPYGAWVTHVDAHDGKIVWRYNDVNFLYSGTVQGDADQSGYCEGQQTSPFRNLFVNVSGIGSATTDSTGAFSLPGTGGDRAVSCQLNGTKVNVNDVQFGDSNFNGTVQENIPLTINWSDATPSRRAERDVYYWVNETHAYIKRLDPTWDIPLHTANVNVANTCNANWSTWNMNFFREGGGCANTGVIGGVVAHEYGHGIQFTLLGYQGNEGLGEGNADIAGSFMTDDSVVGRGFYLNQCGSGIRDCENTLRYPQDVVGQGVHNAGRVICGFHWDLRQMLEVEMGPNTGKPYTGALWHWSRKLYTPDFQPEQVQAYFLVDDDDANLGNGTPNYDEICEAATNHGFSCPALTEYVTIVHTPLTDTTDPGPYTVSATITATGPFPLDTSSATIYYSLNGGPYSSVPMSHLGGDSFEGQIPSQAHGTAVAYYLEARNTAGTVGTAPADAPDDYYLFAVGVYSIALDDNIETDQGWTVTEPGTDGTWERADPNGTYAGTTPINPEDDHTLDPGVICWVTGNPPPGSTFLVEELDGRTVLTSPVLDLSGATLARGTVWLWSYSNTPADDYMNFEVSTDGGGTWALVERVSGIANLWTEHSFMFGPFDFAFTSQIRFRFVALDQAGDNIVEFAMDDFRLLALTPEAEAVAQDPLAGQPLSFVLHGSRPNPFNPSTEIRYQLPERSPVKLTVFDVTGREIRVLVDGVEEAGAHGVEWDGKDGSGKAMGSGVYFYRLKAGSFEETRRMALVK